MLESANTNLNSKEYYENIFLENISNFLRKEKIITRHFGSINEVIEFLRKEKNKTNELKGLSRLIDFFKRVLENFNNDYYLISDLWFSDLSERYRFLYSETIKEIFISSFESFPSEKRKHLKRLNKPQNLLSKLEEDFKLNKGEIVIVAHFLKLINGIYYLEERKRQRFTGSSEKKPASWHFYKVVENIIDFYRSLEGNASISNSLLEYKKVLERYKLPILIAAIFHDSVEDKRFTLPLNFINDIVGDEIVKESVNNGIFYLPPKVIFDDEENCIINSFFNRYFEKFVEFKNIKVKIRKLDSGVIQIDEEGLINLNKKELEKILRFSLISIYSGIVEDGRVLHLKEDEIALVLSTVDSLTQRKHGSWYNEEGDGKYKYLYLKQYLDKLSKNKFAILVKWADFLDNVRGELSEKQKVKYLKYYIPFFRKAFGVTNLLHLVPEKIKKEIKYQEVLDCLTNKF